MHRLHARACAKINVSLKILGRRPDGFHELRTVFQTVQLADRLTFQFSAGRGVRLECPPTAAAPDVPDGAENLAYRALELGWEAFGIGGQVVLRLEKRIPTQAGLGGGSSDAATVLEVLARRARRRPPDARLWELAAALGSDVACFLLGGTVLGLGRGEETYPLPDLPRWSCLLAMPPTGVATAGAFRAWDALHPTLLTGQPRSSTLYEFCGSVYRALPASRLGRGHGLLPGAPHVQAGIENDFSEVVFPSHPDFARLRARLLKAGARGAGLSGSGAAQFALFPDRRAALVAAGGLTGFRTWVTRFVTRREYQREWVRPTD